MSESFVSILDVDVLQLVFGASDKHLRRIRKALDIQVTLDKNRIRVAGEPDNVVMGSKLLEQLQKIVRRQGVLGDADIDRAVAEIREGNDVTDLQPVDVFSGRQIRPRTAGQVRYIEALNKNSLCFCIGPAGTGKTYLAVAMAAAALKTQKIRKIVLVRPAVEAGESLGFLPGDLQAKINPYLRPLFDALSEMMDHEMRQQLMQDDVIEVVPLAYMRGRTLSNAFIILDEAQNTTVSQMKMFLTRMGEGSTIIVSGDTTQIDLPTDKTSGLNDALRRLKSIRGVAVVKLNRSDIVRHRLVQDIVEAYEETPTPPRKKEHPPHTRKRNS
jgi:phosphate starvation-inducible protein PhoH and related proteins